MIDSFIIGGLSAGVIALAVIGWNFFRLKTPTDKQLIIRLILGSCIVVFNVIVFVGSFAAIMTTKDDDFTTGMLIGLFVLLIPFIIVGRILYKDVVEFLLRRRENQDKNKKEQIEKFENLKVIKEEKIYKESTQKQIVTNEDKEEKYEVVKFSDKNETVNKENDYKKTGSINNIKLFVTVLSIVFVIVLVGYILIPKIKGKKDKIEELTQSEQEMVGTYRFIDAQYNELYLGEMITCHYPNGPTYFNQETKKYLDAQIVLTDDKNDSQISGKLILSTETYEFTWTRFAKKVIYLNKNLYFSCGNDKSTFKDGTDYIFIEDNTSIIYFTLMSGNYTIFYSFEKI